MSRRVWTEGRGGAWPTARALGLAPTRPFSISAETMASLAICSLVSVSFFGFFGVLFFIAGTMALIAYRPLESGRDLVRFLPFLAMPLLAIISTIWSDSPQASMKSGLQVLLTFVAAITVARNLRPERLILLLFGGFFAICLAQLPNVPGSLASGQPMYSSMLGSKNQVGFVGYMLFALALPIIVDRKQHYIARIAAVGSIPMALLIVALAQSGGTTTSILIVLIVFPSLAIVGMLNLSSRIVLLVVTAALLAVCFVMRHDIEAAVTAFRVNVLHKDATLTGRTYLWEFADRLIAQRPLLGQGYGSFWLQGNIDAEGLWRWGGIASRGDSTSTMSS